MVRSVLHRELLKKLKGAQIHEKSKHTQEKSHTRGNLRGVVRTVRTVVDMAVQLVGGVVMDATQLAISEYLERQNYPYADTREAFRQHIQMVFSCEGNETEKE
jgi:hypothetical protein